MKAYDLPCGWSIAIPEDWQAEYDRASGQCIFFPNDSDLTLRITPFHAERDGVPAPAQVMEKAFVQSVPPSAVPRDAAEYSLSGFAAKMYENAVPEGVATVCTIYVGYYAAGELLSVSVWGTDKAECGQALDILKTAKLNR